MQKKYALSHKNKKSNFCNTLITVLFIKFSRIIIFQSSKSYISPLFISNQLIFFRESFYCIQLKEISIQPPKEPREHHLGIVRPKKIELHKIS